VGTHKPAQNLVPQNLASMPTQARYNTKGPLTNLMHNIHKYTRLGCMQVRSGSISDRHDRLKSSSPCTRHTGRCPGSFKAPDCYWPNTIPYSKGRCTATLYGPSKSLPLELSLHGQACAKGSSPTTGSNSATNNDYSETVTVPQIMTNDDVKLVLLIVKHRIPQF
jgi:hypothetical protein